MSTNYTEGRLYVNIKIDNPKSHNDLVSLAEKYDYKKGWAYYKAKELGFAAHTEQTSLFDGEGL